MSMTTIIMLCAGAALLGFGEWVTRKHPEAFMEEDDK